MLESFLATVISVNETTQFITVQPLITNVDGQDHIEIDCKTLGGQVVEPDDILLLQPIKNDLSGESISDYEPATRANCVAVGVFTPKVDYKLKGDYRIEGNLFVTGSIDVSGSLIIAGKDYAAHTHGPGIAPNNYLDSTPAPITGVSGVVTP